MWRRQRFAVVVMSCAQVVTAIAAGAKHSAAVTSSGRLLVWGQRCAPRCDPAACAMARDCGTVTGGDDVAGDDVAGDGAASPGETWPVRVVCTCPLEACTPQPFQLGRGSGVFVDVSCGYDHTVAVARVK